jgi:hypothetical protein
VSAVADGGELLVCDAESIAAAVGEASAWRWVGQVMAVELNVSEAQLLEAVLQLREVAAVPCIPANVRSHQRNRIIAAMFGRRPVSGGRRRREEAPGPLRRVRVE